MIRRRYSKYTQTHLGWLAQMPSHWRIKRLKHLGHAIIGLTYGPEDVLAEGEGTLVLRSSNVQSGRLSFGDNVFVSKAIPEELRTRGNDILICSRNGSRALIGKNARIDEASAGVTFGAFMTIFRGELNEFLYWVFNSPVFEYQSGTFLTATINQLTVGDLRAIEVPTPPASEALEIARFLNYEATRIDALIEKQRQLIDLLKEKRRAVISHAVTKGLNPDAPLRDTGIEWLGKVPAHWSISAPKYFTTRIIDGPHHTPSYIDDGIPFVTVKNLTAGERISLEDTKRISRSDHLQFVKRAHPRPGDILITKDGTLGVTRVVETDAEFSIFVSVALVQLRRSADPWFVRFAFESSSTWAQFSIMAAGAALKHIVLSTIANVRIPMPPLEEQQEIARHLRAHCAKMDALVETSERRVDLLQERRTALISAAVTGKIDVRGWKPPKSDVEDAVA